jgi:hypothetical protein
VKAGRHQSYKTTAQTYNNESEEERA